MPTCHSQSKGFCTWTKTTKSVAERLAMVANLSSQQYKATKTHIIFSATKSQDLHEFDFTSDKKLYLEYIII